MTGGRATELRTSELRATELRAALDAVRHRIARAAAAAARPASEVALLAVSKTVPLADIELVAGFGQQDFGESRAQECAAKAPARPDLRWHFVGRLQTNKARRVGALCAAVHSLDRAELLAPLGRGAGAAGRPLLPVFLQVNLSGNPRQGGVEPAGLGRLADSTAAAAGVRLAGVMAIAPAGGDPKAAFAALRALSERLVADHPRAAGISAGMSGDLEAAVAEGATIVRVGGALFGRRARVRG